jgi:hypothetical protein
MRLAALLTNVSALPPPVADLEAAPQSAYIEVAAPHGNWVSCMPAEI